MKMIELPHVRAEEKLKVVLDEYDEVDVDASRQTFWIGYDTELANLAKRKLFMLADSIESVVRALAVGYPPETADRYIKEKKITIKNRKRIRDILSKFSAYGDEYCEWWDQQYGHLVPAKGKKQIGVRPKLIAEFAPQNQGYVGEDDPELDEVVDAEVLEASEDGEALRRTDRQPSVPDAPNFEDVRASVAKQLPRKRKKAAKKRKATS